jgi:hypothetical protein
MALDSGSSDLDSFLGKHGNNSNSDTSDLDSFLSRQQSPASSQKPSGTLGAYGQTLKEAVKGIPSYVASAIEGSTPYDEQNALDTIQETSKARNEAFVNGPNADAPVFGGLAKERDIRQAAESLSGSMAGMAPTVAGAALGSFAGPIGTVVGGLVGAGAGLVGMKRAAENQFVKQNIDKTNADRQAQGLPPLSLKESVALQNQLNASGDTSKIGYSEALPETLGNVAETAILASPVGKAGKFIGTLASPLARAAATGLAKAGGTVLTEMGEEEVTRQLQNPVMQQHGFPEQTAGETAKQTVIATAPFAALGLGVGGVQGYRAQHQAESAGPLSRAANTAQQTGAANAQATDVSDLPADGAASQGDARVSGQAMGGSGAGVGTDNPDLAEERATPITQPVSEGGNDEQSINGLAEQRDGRGSLSADGEGIRSGASIDSLPTERPHLADQLTEPEAKRQTAKQRIEAALVDPALTDKARQTLQNDLKLLGAASDKALDKTIEHIGNRAEKNGVVLPEILPEGVENERVATDTGGVQEDGLHPGATGIQTELSNLADDVAGGKDGGIRNQRSADVETALNQLEQEPVNRPLPDSAIQQGGIDAKVPTDTGIDEQPQDIYRRNQSGLDPVENGLPETRPPLADDITQKSDAELEVLRQNTFNVRTSEALQRRADLVAEQERRNTLPPQEQTDERKDANEETGQAPDQKGPLLTFTPTHELADGTAVRQEEDGSYTDRDNASYTPDNESRLLKPAEIEAYREQETQAQRTQDNPSLAGDKTSAVLPASQVDMGTDDKIQIKNEPVLNESTQNPTAANTVQPPAQDANPPAPGTFAPTPGTQAEPMAAPVPTVAPVTYGKVSTFQGHKTISVNQGNGEHAPSELTIKKRKDGDAYHIETPNGQILFSGVKDIKDAKKKVESVLSKVHVIDGRPFAITKDGNAILLKKAYGAATGGTAKELELKASLQYKREQKTQEPTIEQASPSTPTPSPQESGAQPSPILTQPKKQYLLDQKRAYLKANPKAIKSAKDKAFADMESAYEDDLLKAEVQLPFEAYRQRNPKMSDGLARQTYDNLRQSFELPVEQNQAQPSDVITNSPEISSKLQSQPVAPTPVKTPEVEANQAAAVAETQSRKQAYIIEESQGQHPIVKQKNSVAKWINDLSDDDYNQLNTFYDEDGRNPFPSSLLANTTEPLKLMAQMKSVVSDGAVAETGAKNAAVEQGVNLLSEDTSELDLSALPDREYKIIKTERQVASKLRERIAKGDSPIAHYDNQGNITASAGGNYSIRLNLTKEEKKTVRSLINERELAETQEERKQIDEKINKAITPATLRRLNGEAVSQQPAQKSPEATPVTDDVSKKGESLDASENKKPSSVVAEEATSDEGRVAPIIAKDDIPYDTAYRAYSGISFDPDKRAKSTQEEYVNYMQSVYDDIIKIAKTDEQRATIDAAFETYRQGYVQKQLSHLQAKSRVISPMISGPANFPTRRNEKANNAEHKRLEEFLEWDKKAISRLKAIARGTRSQEEIRDERFEAVKRDLASSLSTIKGIDNGTVRGSSRSLFVNNLTNRIKTLARNGNTDLVNKALDYIADYQKDLAKPLISPKHSVWELRGKVSEQPAQIEKPTGTETIKEYQGASVVNNRDAERVQILFDEKPSEQVRNALKKEAFKWSPSNNAWQRQNTPNGIAAAKRVLNGLYGEPAKLSQSQPTTGSTVAELTAKLDTDDKKLLQSGKLNIVQSVADVPKHVLDTGDRMTRKNSVVAWHGSGADFERFDSTHALTGEGAQAFGAGHYFTDKKEIASFYQSRLGGGDTYIRGVIGHKDGTSSLTLKLDYPNAIKSDADALAVDAMSRFGNAREAETYISSRTSAYGGPGEQVKNEAIALLKNGLVEYNPKGKLYQVELAPNDDELLDWNKPLSQQSDKIKSIIAEHELDDILNSPSQRFQGKRPDYDATGEELYRALSESGGSQQEASDNLHRVGIRGIRYLAEQGKSGASNYVIFDDNDITIKEKYSRNERIEGFYDPKSKKIYIIADNVTPETLRSTLNHEYLHAALDQNPKLRERLLGAQSELRDIFAQVESGKYTGRYQAIYDAAMKRVDRANTPAADRYEEFLAYAVSEHSKDAKSLPERLAKAVQNLVAAIKAAIFKYSGRIDRIGPAELSSLAKSAMSYSENSNNSNAMVMASTKSLPDKITIDGKERWTINSNGKPIAQDEEGVRNFWKWFGESRVTDEDGKPMVVYHGTNNIFTDFNRTGDIGYHFGTDVAARDRASKIGSAGVLVEPIHVSRVERDSLLALNGEIGGTPVLDLYALLLRKLDNPRNDLREQLSGMSENEINETKSEYLEHEDSTKFVERINRAKIGEGFRVEVNGETVSTHKTAREANARADRLREQAAKPMALYINTKNLIRLPDLGVWPAQEIAKESGFNRTEMDRVANADNINAQYEEVRSILEGKGYDGIIYRNEVEHTGEDSYIAFRSNQIKSAIGNVGTFAPQNPDIRYSIADDVRDNAQNITSGLIERLSTNKTFNWWHKTVGTQFHKALVDKHFGKVFNRSMQFEQDMARLANEAADLAPSLLPKLDALTDVGNELKEFAQGAVKGQAGRRMIDSRRIGEAVFQTTLQDKPMTDKELTDAGYSESQRKMYREFFAAVNQSLDDLAKSEMFRMARALKIGQAPDNLSLKETANWYAEQAEDVNQGKDFIDKAAQVAKLKKEGYAPLMRFGQYTLDVVTPKPDGTEKREFFGMFETEQEAKEMEKAMRSEYPDANIERGIMSQNDWQMFKGVTPETMEVFAKMMNVEQDEAFQAYLKSAVTNRSAMKRLIHRKKMPGFAKDTQRILASFLTSNARAASKNYHLGELVDAIAAIPKTKGDVIDESVELYNYVQNPSAKGAAIRGLMFAWYLGGSVSSAAVNLTQSFTTTLPYLHQFGETNQVARLMGQAMKLAANHNAITGDIGKALQRADKEGITEPHELHMLYGESMRTGMLSNQFLRPLSKVWGSFFSLAESYNRRVSFIAAYNLAKETNQPDPFQFAANAVNETQFVYSKSSRPNWARSTVGSTVFTFKTFTLSYLEFLKRLPAKERALALGVLVLFAGLSGAPGADDLDDLIDTAGQAMGYNTNSKAWKDRVLSDFIGREAAQYALYGLSHGMPFDVSSRLSVGNIIPGSALFKKSEIDKSRDVMEFAGPAGSLSKRIVDAFEAAGSRDSLTGQASAVGKALVPKAMSDVVQAMDMQLTGQYRDTRGRKVADADLPDVIAKALGFQPTSVAEPRRAERYLNQSVTMAKAVEGDIAGLWASGIVEKNRGKVDEAKTMLQDWNAKNPETPIRVNMKQITRRVKQMRLTSGERLLKSTPKEIRRYAREAINE